jgi:CTD small phosphatase-like protein 2
VFEVVIFTAGLKEYADWILNQVDRKRNLIHHRLYRNSCKPTCGIYLKDLERLGRDIRKTLIVDNIADNFEL